VRFFVPDDRITVRSTSRVPFPSSLPELPRRLGLALPDAKPLRLRFSLQLFQRTVIVECLEVSVERPGHPASNHLRAEIDVAVEASDDRTPRSCLFKVGHLASKLAPVREALEAGYMAAPDIVSRKGQILFPCTAGAVLLMRPLAEADIRLAERNSRFLG
jgi:hypothetical protein